VKYLHCRNQIWVTRSVSYSGRKGAREIPYWPAPAKRLRYNPVFMQDMVGMPAYFGDWPALADPVPVVDILAELDDAGGGWAQAVTYAQ